MKFFKRHNKEDEDLNLMGFGIANEDIDLIEFNKLDENTDPNLEGAFLVAFDDLPKQKQDKLLELADRMDEKVHQAFQTMDNENLIQHLKYVEVVKVARLGATFSLISTILPWFYALLYFAFTFQESALMLGLIISIATLGITSYIFEIYILIKYENVSPTLDKRSLFSLEKSAANYCNDYALRFYGEIHKAVVDEDNRFMTI